MPGILRGMFWKTKQSPEIETRDADLTDEDGVLDALWSGQATGTTAVSGALALRVPAVASAIRVISEAAACLQVRIMVRNDDGTEEEDHTHPVGVLLRGDVNPWTSGFELIRDLIADALTKDWGGLAFVNRVGDEVREIIRYQPSMISVSYDPKTGEPTYRIEGMVRPARDILHLRGPFDRSPLTLAAEAIGVASVMEKHAASLFKNGAMPGSVILNKKGLGSKGALEMLKGWRKAFAGPEKTGKTAVLWDDADVKQLSLNSVDSEFTASRKFQILEICRAFRVSPTLIFDYDRATWSNGEQSGREFLVYTLLPWLIAVEAALGRVLFSREERKRYRVLLDRDDLTRADMAARATTVTQLIAAESMSPDEARSWFDLPPRADGQGGKYRNPHINPKASTPETEDAPKVEPTSDTVEADDAAE